MKAAKKRPSGPVAGRFGRSSSAESAGESVSALNAEIKTEIAIDLPHPRSYKIKTAPEFVSLKERLVEEIRAEALKVAAAA